MKRTAESSTTENALLVSKHSQSRDQLRIAVLIPCFNEELTVTKVVSDFRRELPEADIYVFDNASTDQTAELARQAGAHVRNVKKRGKGNVVQAMFSTVDADVYIMVDGDDTYPADRIYALMQPIFDERADMTVGSRLMMANSEFRLLNLLGNHLLLKTLNLVFRVRLTDILSGYRVMNREFVENIYVLSTGFEVEAELTIRALEEGYLIQEVPVRLGTRPEGSHSKIRVIRDGLRILSSIMILFRDYQPLFFFTVIGLILVSFGLVLGLSVFEEFLATGLVPRLPSAVLSASLVLLGIFVMMVGLILDTLNRRFREMHYQLRRLTRGRR